MTWNMVGQVDISYCIISKFIWLSKPIMDPWRLDNPERPLQNGEWGWQRMLMNQALQH